MRFLVLLLALPLLAGCSFIDPDPVACTLEFRSYTVEVVDESGDPVGGLTTTSRNERTGEVYDVQADVGPQDDGVYMVLTDGHTVSRRGDTVRFEARGHGLFASGDFEFYSDACHVNLRSGPETLVARPE